MESWASALITDSLTALEKGRSAQRHKLVRGRLERVDPDARREVKRPSAVTRGKLWVLAV